jgi:hypothetical protein
MIEPKRIEFEVMGLDKHTSDLLNWVMQYRDNCETLKDSNFMESESIMVSTHFDHLKVIMKIEKPVVYKKT